MKTETVIGYIDGFNLYFGLKEMGWKRYYWMNVEDLCVNLLKKNQLLSTAHYFTSRITNNPYKQRRQSTYLEALSAIGIQPVYGKYRHNPYTCFKSNTIHKIAQEKMTDVALATQLLIDGYLSKYDTALIISGDIDLIPAIMAVKQRLKNKKVVMAFPPMRVNSDFNNIVDGCLQIDERLCKKSQLPDMVERGDGFQLKKPLGWV